MDGVKNFTKGQSRVSGMGNLQSVCVGVIDSSIKSQDDASTDSKSRIFRRKLGDAPSAFQKTRSTLSKDF